MFSNNKITLFFFSGCQVDIDDLQQNRMTKRDHKLLPFPTFFWFSY